MKTITTTENYIAVLESRIKTANEQIALIAEDQTKVMQIMADCGLYSHFQQLQMRLESNLKLMRAHENDRKKWSKELQKEKEFLVHLQERKQSM